MYNRHWRDEKDLKDMVLSLDMFIIKDYRSQINAPIELRKFSDISVEGKDSQQAISVSVHRRSIEEGTVMTSYTRECPVSSHCKQRLNSG